MIFSHLTVFYKYKHILCSFFCLMVYYIHRNLETENKDEQNSVEGALLPSTYLTCALLSRLCHVHISRVCVCVCSFRLKFSLLPLLRSHTIICTLSRASDIITMRFETLLENVYSVCIYVHFHRIDAFHCVSLK